MKEKIKEKMLEAARWLGKKARIVWDKAKEIFRSVVKFMKENPIVTVALISLARTVINNSSRLMIQYHDKIRHDRGFFDRRTGKWSYAKKTPNRYQSEEIEWRYQNGESYRSILDDLNILKTK